MKFGYILLMIASVFSIKSYAFTQDEINHLLTFVSTTSCTYERNGTRHNGQEAMAHIKKKYEYYADDIHSTEDFIKYSATKSKMSGKHYKIHCEGKPEIKSKQWLLAELAAYRASKK
ncbi:DUF5329 family protein [Psychrosphaera algicola]|uniref:DUF5329 family protein n=1 Tax=Psychrosphaera algicola TaxID=3023714 RepID=A0ABT5FBN0_9GAMM|nr:DUF5329 family protein [Psychrosphaera sp. G1-22]MDC2888953.1 DUF5329 family protein [Psychrosphaera sp. G1-22]